jgi:hypothetical protein
VVRKSVTGIAHDGGVTLSIVDYARAVVPDEGFLPADLEDIPAGARLATAVESVDRRRLSADDTVRLLRAEQRLVAHWQAHRASSIAEVVSRTPGDLAEFAHLEVGAALRLTGVAARNEVARSLDLVHRLPEVHALLAAGELDWWRSMVFVDETSHLDDESARSVATELVGRAPSLTTGQLRRRLRRRCLELGPREAAERVAEVVASRRVVLEATFDGSANLHLLDLPPDLATAAWERIDSFARSQAADDRSADQRRADAALDLLAGTVDQRAGTVEITVDLTTLLALDDSPADLGRFGPVVADIARQVVGKHERGRWLASVVDGDRVPHAVAVRRRPTADIARRVRTRDRTCVFPGCARSSRRSDLDHTVPHAQGGPTVAGNLAPLCRFHHRAKDEGGWTYRRSLVGSVVWTSPMGQVYVTGGRDP